MASTPRSSSVVMASTRRATSRRASTSRPLSISSSTANFGRRTASCSVSARFCSPPENSTLRPRSRNCDATPRRSASVATRRAEVVGVATLAVEGGGEEVVEPHARQLHRVLQREEQPARGTLVRGQVEQLVAVDGDRAAGDGVVAPTHQHVRERRLARAVRPHERVHLARPDLEVDPPQDLLPRHRGVQVRDLQHTHRRAPEHREVASPEQLCAVRTTQPWGGGAHDALTITSVPSMRTS